MQHENKSSAHTEAVRKTEKTFFNNSWRACLKTGVLSFFILIKPEKRTIHCRAPSIETVVKPKTLKQNAIFAYNKEKQPKNAWNI